MSKKDEIKYLLERYISRTATEREYQRLFELLEEKKEIPTWRNVISEMMEQQDADPDYERSYWEPVISRIFQKDRPANKITGRKKTGLIIKRILAAAAVVLLIGIGAWFLWQNELKEKEVVAAGLNETENDIQPGGNKAILTLANGKSIVLDSTKNGLLSMQGGTKVIKLNNGLLAYNKQLAVDNGQLALKNRENKVLYNTITTPRGGQYQVILPDGSKVWLNAASSIRFPTAFIKKERQVQVTGEAYFEVAKDETTPFTVSVNDMQVKVLGTEFNIMAYTNEPAIQTTLLKGAVEIREGNSRARLEPGQQARVSKEGKIRLVEHLDLDEVMAWKTGLFQFSDDDIGHIMRQIARWYNVEVMYENGIPEGHITGKIPRNTNLSQVLKILQLSGIHFKIEGKKVIVLTG